MNDNFFYSPSGSRFYAVMINGRKYYGDKAHVKGLAGLHHYWNGGYVDQLDMMETAGEIKPVKFKTFTTNETH